MPDNASTRDCVVIICSAGQMAEVRTLWTGLHYKEISGLPDEVFGLARAFKGVGIATPAVEDYDQRILMFATEAPAAT